MGDLGAVTKSAIEVAEELRAERDEARAKLALADRLAEAARPVADLSVQLEEALDVFDAAEARVVELEREAVPEPHPDTVQGCGAYIGGYCGDEGQLCGACVLDAAWEAESGG